MNWPARYVGIPYADDGFTHGFHCWSLVRTVLSDEAGIDVPHYGETEAKDFAAVAQHMNADAVRDPWREVAPGDAMEFDVAVMAGRVRNNGTSRRAPIHCGIMIDPIHVLHVEEATDAVIVPLHHPTIKFRLLKLYRHKVLWCD